MSYIQALRLPQALVDMGYQLAIYRGDLEHADAPGNKWHKLKYNIAQAQAQGAQVIASFGGPFSNHLHALGALCPAYGMQAIAVVRGELQPQLTPTLQDFVRQGGLLWPSSRIDYRAGMESLVRQEIETLYGECYWVPEGGSNQAGVLGCYDWAQSIAQRGGSEFDNWVVSAGTGATAAGLLASPYSPSLSVIPALKGGEGLRADIIAWAEEIALMQGGASGLQAHASSFQAYKFRLYADYHGGGYAKFSPELKAFLQAFALLNPNVRLDPVYTAKAVFGLMQEMQAQRWPHKTNLMIHTGGLQGWRGYSGYC